MSKGFQPNPILEHAGLLEIAAAQADIEHATKERNALIEHYISQGVRAHVIAAQLRVSRATLYRMIAATTAPEAPSRAARAEKPQVEPAPGRAKTRTSKKLAAATARIDAAPLPATQAKRSRQAVDSHSGGQGQPARRSRAKAATSSSKTAAKPAAKSRRQSSAGTKASTSGVSKRAASAN